MLSFNELQTTSAAFRISGPDANTYLNGQFTQELRISPGQIAYGLWLNQKGKVLGDSHVLRLAAAEHLVFAERVEPNALRQRLEDYLIADEVTIAEETGTWRAALIWGDGVGAALARWFPGFGQSQQFGASDEAFACAAWGGRGGFFWIWFPERAAALWRSRLLGVAEAVDAAAATRARIAAGIPAVPDDIGPDDLPNEGGLDAVAISYTKGCYLGQEVMARLKNLGQVRRRLHIIRGGVPQPPPKTPLFQAGKRVGETRSAAPEGDGFVGFAMLSLVNFAPAAPLQLGENGPTVEAIRHG